ncbi:hypothetical protein [Streptomyces sp. ISL-96]|uniref:hypothetical protein n=1 Tax=Streptomyces sp. ISL-96 TaxID=2819191 RepID=UPI002035BB3A|nr:hypothetical protein [Streptomyces sp. ISL-96]
MTRRPGPGPGRPTAVSLHRRLVRDHEHHPPADRHLHRALTGRMSRDDLTLGAGPAQLQVREEQIVAQAEAARDEIAELTARLGELDQATDHMRITRKTLLDLPDQGAGARPVRSGTAGPPGLQADHGRVRRN